MPETSSNDWVFRKNSIRLSKENYECWIHFVTIVTRHRKKFFANPIIADATIETLLGLRSKRRFNLYSYCLMPDHFHALIGIGESGMNLGSICGQFKSLSTREFWKYREGKLWQRQYFDHVIRNEQDFYETVWYIRDNPVRARLARDWRDWPYYGEPDLNVDLR